MRGVIISHMDVIEFYDHLVPLSGILDVPILVTEDSPSLKLLETYYPELQLKVLGYEEYNAKNLVETYDYLIFSCNVRKADEFLVEQEKLQGKTLCKIFCPHGFSDKTYYWQNYTNKDLTFVYGQNMLDTIAEVGIKLKDDRTIPVGNYRYEYFKKHKNHQKKIFNELISKGMDPSKKTVLYVPTWDDLAHAFLY